MQVLHLLTHLPAEDVQCTVLGRAAMRTLPNLSVLGRGMGFFIPLARSSVFACVVSCWIEGLLILASFAPFCPA